MNTKRFVKILVMTMALLPSITDSYAVNPEVKWDSKSQIIDGERVI